MDGGIIEAAIEAVAERMIEGIHTSMPGTVKAIEPGGTLTVQPDINTKGSDGETLLMPLIYGVPFLFPTAGSIVIESIPQTGDKVLLMFSERALDSWVTSQSQTEEVDARRHSLTDAVAIGGFIPGGASFKGIRDTKTGTSIEFTKTGGININNGALEVL